MLNILISLLFIAGAYLLGSIPWGFLIGKIYGIDVRLVGSRNIGATNVTRTVGRGAGKLCFILDFLKGALPVLTIQICFWKMTPQEATGIAAGCPEWALIATMLAAVLGHIFPVFLKFHGGKGVSTAAGAIVALAPLPLLVAAVVWVVVFLVSRYVSLASISSAIVLPVMAWLFKWLDLGTRAAQSTVTLCFLTFVAILAVARHHENIRRLLNGTESRFGKTAAADAPPAEETDK